MKRHSYPVSIGPGLFAQVSRRESLIEAYRRLQRTCEHAKRDPKGTCYRCGASLRPVQVQVARVAIPEFNHTTAA